MFDKKRENIWMLTYQDGGGEWERRDGRRQSYGGGARQSGDLALDPGCCQVAPCRDKSSTRGMRKLELSQIQ